MMKKVLLIGVILFLIASAAGALWFFRFRSKAEAQPAFRMAPIERGDIVQLVRSTGIIQPIQLVQVGTQVNGPVIKLYVDFNDLVHEGDLVAQIDPRVYEANLARDEANLQQTLANVEQTQARLLQAERELTRSQELARRDMLSTSDLDTALSARDVLLAQLKLNRAAVDQARASLSLSRANLDYTRIRSPVNGVIIDRNVSEGQTVVASMSAQTLFQIATDLSHVQVAANIPEADIGKIAVGQPVKFTVDAYEQEFTGSVSQIRLAAVTVQSVVTYPVIILASNPNGKLFPGMTANLACEVARRADVLKIPNAALRFTPPDSANAPAAARPRRGDAQPGPRLWIQTNTKAPPLSRPVKTGIGDGSMTELVEAKDLEVGQEVLIGLRGNEKNGAKTVNPFTPQMPGGGRRPH
jgi:HlyD family secretion protein